MEKFSAELCVMRIESWVGCSSAGLNGNNNREPEAISLEQSGAMVKK